MTDSLPNGAKERTGSPLAAAFSVDADRVRAHVDQVVRGTVQETLNALLDAEADRACGAGRYERSPDRQDTRAGSYKRKLATKAGEVELKVPRLRKLPLETAIIERYRRRESSVEEALIEMYLAGVSVRRVEPTKTTIFVNDLANPTGYAQVIEEHAANADGTTGALDTTYVVGNDVIGQARAANATPHALEYLLYDGHGSTRGLRKADGTSLESYDYDAFGISLLGNPASPLTTLLYSGEQYDVGLREQYLRARYYDPALGRFSSFDLFEGSTGDPQTLHKYLYANANPVYYTDPSGHLGFVEILGVIGIIGVVATFLGAPNVANAPAPGDPVYGDRSGDMVIGMALDLTFVELSYLGGKLLSYGGTWVRNSVSKWYGRRVQSSLASRLASQARRWQGLSAEERSAAGFLESRGRYVEKNLLEGVEGAGRQGDVFVDGLKTEIKTVSGGGTQQDLVKRSIKALERARRGAGQAEHVLLDARGTELSEESAGEVIRRWFGKSEETASVEIIGDGFFVSPFEPATVLH